MTKYKWRQLTPRQKVELCLQAAGCTEHDLAAYLGRKTAYVNDLQQNHKEPGKKEDMLIYRLYCGNLAEADKFGTVPYISTKTWNRAIVKQGQEILLSYVKTLYMAANIADRVRTLVKAYEDTKKASIYVTIESIYGANSGDVAVYVKSWKLEGLWASIHLAIDGDKIKLHYLTQRFPNDPYSNAMSSTCTDAAVRKFAGKAKKFMIGELKNKKLL